MELDEENLLYGEDSVYFLVDLNELLIFEDVFDVVVLGFWIEVVIVYI